MSSSSNYVFARNIGIGGLYLLTLFCSLSILGIHRFTNCDKLLMNALVIISGVIFLVSLVGIIGLCFGLSWRTLLWVYMVVMTVMIMMLFTITVFTLVVTYAGAGRKLPDRGYKEYRLGDYSSWLRKRYDGSWNKIQTCLIRQDACDKVEYYNNTVCGTTPTFDEFRAMRLSSVQAGCCKPPDECNFEYVNPLVWTKPASSRLVNSTNVDCALWDNDPSALCFNCSSCKAGFINKVKGEWKEVSTLSFISLAGLLVFYFYGGYLLRSKEESWPVFPDDDPLEPAAAAPYKAS